MYFHIHRHGGTCCSFPALCAVPNHVHYVFTASLTASLASQPRMLLAEDTNRRHVHGFKGNVTKQNDFTNIA